MIIKLTTNKRCGIVNVCSDNSHNVYTITLAGPLLVPWYRIAINVYLLASRLTRCQGPPHSMIHLTRLLITNGIHVRLRFTPTMIFIRKCLMQRLLWNRVQSMSILCLVRKRDGNERWCIDMRKLDFHTIQDCCPIARIEQCLDTICVNRYFSTLDLLSGYWQRDIFQKTGKHSFAD